MEIEKISAPFDQMIIIGAWRFIECLFWQFVGGAGCAFLFALSGSRDDQKSEAIVSLFKFIQ